MHDKLTMIGRILLGLILVIFGLNKFLGFIPIPPMSGAAGAYMGGLFAAGYFFPVLALTEIIFGALLIAGFFVPLSLTVLAPVILHINLFHLFLAPEGLAVPIVMLVIELYLAHQYKESFAGVLKAK